MIYQYFILRLDCPGQFHKIMTVSNEKFDYILNHWVWEHCIDIAVTSQNNPIERIFVYGGFLFSFSFFQIDIMQPFSAEPPTFSKEYKQINFCIPNTCKNCPRKLLIIGPNFFFSVLPISPKQAQITYFCSKKMSPCETAI